jgi:signal transduction histidine kinase
MNLSADTYHNNELERIIALSDYDLDYSTLSKNFEDLTLLAARFSGTEISLINLLDNYTQWTVAQHGIAVDHMPCEDSVCQHTIKQPVDFEVKDLSTDARFKSTPMVNDYHIKYYYGVPITTSTGHNLGALCVLHSKEHEIDDDKKELLKIIAREVVNRLNTFKKVENLKQQITKLTQTKQMMAHDIRGSLSGIIGLSQLGCEEGSTGVTTGVLDYMRLINESSKSAILLLEDILDAELEQSKQLSESNYNLKTLKEKLIDLFAPRALKKKTQFAINISEETANDLFPKGQLLQITGNLISNAIKFTPEGQQVTVNLELKHEPAKQLQIQVTDSGVGMEPCQIDALLNGTGHSTSGTDGEVGYGIGLVLVKQIIDHIQGDLAITSVKNSGTVITVSIQL